MSKNNNKKTVDDYLNDALKKIDEQNGIGGKYIIMILEMGLDHKFAPLFGVKNLTKEAAKRLFDQFDESNFIIEGRQLMIEMLRDDGDNNFTKCDMTILPNIFTEGLN